MSCERDLGDLGDALVDALRDGDTDRQREVLAAAGHSRAAVFDTTDTAGGVRLVCVYWGVDMAALR